MDRMLEQKREEKVRRDKLAGLNGNRTAAPALAAGLAETAEKDAAGKSAAKKARKLAAAAAIASGKKACFDFQVGKCTRGADCTYGHFADPEALKRAQSQTRARSASPAQERGRSPGKGKGKGKGGGSQRVASVPRTDADRAKIPCVHFARGQCLAAERGGVCRFLHAVAAAVCILGQANGLCVPCFPAAVVPRKELRFSEEIGVPEILCE